jgi:hypothetical protein
VPYPSHLRDWQTFQDQYDADLPDRTLVLYRDGTFARRSNPDTGAAGPGRPAQVELGTTFNDVLTFTPTADLLDAVLSVHQPTWSDGAECHVVVTQVRDGLGQTLFSSGGRAQVRLGPLPAANAPYEVTLLSRFPTGPRASGRNTPRVMTSVVRVLEKLPERALRPGQPTPTATPQPRPCDVEVGGSGFRSMNRTLIVRTELDAAAWAEANGRPAPTPIAIR